MNNMTGEQRKQLIEDIMAQHAGGRETLGTAIRRLRLEVTGLDQESFAAMCDMSTRALYLVETDKGNPTLSTVDSILRKFGLRLGLMSLSAPQSMKPTVHENPGNMGGPADHVPQKPIRATAARGSKPRIATAKKVLVPTSKPARVHATGKATGKQP